MRKGWSCSRKTLLTYPWLRDAGERTLSITLKTERYGDMLQSPRGSCFTIAGRVLPGF